MKKAFSISQIITVMGITSLTNLFVLQTMLVPMVLKLSIITGLVLVVGSAITIIVCSGIFIHRIPDTFVVVSDPLSPIMRFLFISVVIGVLFSFLILGFFYEAQWLKVCLFIGALTAWPIILWARSVYVAFSKDGIAIWNYSSEPTLIEKCNVIDVRSALLGFMFRIRYRVAENEIVARYFFPKGIAVPFVTPASIKDLKAAIGKM